MSGYIYTQIKTIKDVTRIKKALNKGNYPLGMSDCETVGINGDCGYECPIFLNGECHEFQQNMLDSLQPVERLKYETLLGVE